MIGFDTGKLGCLEKRSRSNVAAQGTNASSATSGVCSDPNNLHYACTARFRHCVRLHFHHTRQHMSVLLRQIKETTVELLLVVDSSCEFISNWIRELMVLWCTHVVTLYAYPYPYVIKHKHSKFHHYFRSCRQALSHQRDDQISCSSHRTFSTRLHSRDKKDKSQTGDCGGSVVNVNVLGDRIVDCCSWCCYDRWEDDRVMSDSINNLALLS